MSRDPHEELADWIAALPEFTGYVLAYRVAHMLPAQVPVVRADTAEGVASLAQWVRESPRDPYQVVGVVLSVAAIIDFLLTSTTVEPRMPKSLETEHSKQRMAFSAVQRERFEASWKELRRGALSVGAVDRWQGEASEKMLDEIARQFLKQE